MSNVRRTTQPRPSHAHVRTPATIETLTVALERLSEHRDDDVATAAARILAQIEALDVDPSAQEFERIHAGILSARLGAPTGLGRDWRTAHGIARAVFVRLVRKLKAERMRRASQPAAVAAVVADVPRDVCAKCGRPEFVCPG